MAKISRGGFGGNTAQRFPALTHEHVAGDATVLTVAHVDLPKVQGVQKAVVRFAEFPEFSFWTNATMLGYLTAKLGDETDEWVGKRVPLEKIDVENPSTGEPVRKLYVAPPAEWADMFREFDGASADADKPKAKRATAKRAR